jgi:hypothetical protein
VAVNVTLAPVQIVVAVELAVTLGVSVEFTVIVVPALVAVVGLAHVALEVRTTLIISAFAKVVLV